MLEPKYDEDTVNLGYLKKVISDTEEGIDNTYKNVSRHYASRPKPPYYQGDTWIDGDIVYTCINTRTIGLYQDTDWVTESGAKTEAERKNKTYISQPSNYNPGDMWILQSDEDHRAGQKGEILISTAGRKEYNADDWINMLGYGTMKSINEVAGNLNNAINRIGNVEEAIQDGLIITFYQDTVPEGIHLGDLWYVTGEVEGYTKGKIYRYDGTNWIILNDPAIQEAFDEANEARLVADGKIQSFYSETEPTQNMGVGDLWIDLSNNNQLYRYNGTNWVAVYDTRINELVTTVETVTERVTTVETDLGEIDLKVKETTTKITTIEGNIDNIEILANNAQSTANSAVEGVNNITNTQGEAEGKSIHIEDSAEEPFVDIELYGETSQKTRSGKNLAILGVTSGAIDGVPFTVNNGIININGTTTNTNVNYYFNSFRVNNSGTATFWIEITGYTDKTSGNAAILLQESTDNSTWSTTREIGCKSTSQKQYQVTLDSSKYYRIRFYTIENTFTNATIKIQLEYGTSKTEFEEAGVMPSPDYPSEIENLEGRNKFNTANLSTAAPSTNISINNGVFTQVTADTKANLEWYLQGYNNSSFVDTLATTIKNTLGIVSLKFTKTSSFNALRFGLNGSQRNTMVYIPIDNLEDDKTYVISANIINVTQGSVSWEDMQIEEGTVATPYVPYNTLEFKVEGKNIFDLIADNIISLNDKTNFSIENNQLIINNTSGGYGIQTKILNLKPNTTYTVSCKPSWEIGKGTYWGWRLFNVDANSYSGYAYSDTLTFTTTDKTKYQLLYYLGVPNNNEGEVTLSNVQIEEGSIATDYEPYKSQVATFPLGEEKLMEGSYLADDGVHHSRKQVVFDGSDNEGWNKASLNIDSNGNNYSFYIILDKRPKQDEVYTNFALCSMLTQKRRSYVTTLDEEGIYLGKSNTLYVKIRQALIGSGTVGEFKSWLSQNPMQVEYELAEPETVPYTEEQQDAWNKIKALMTYKNITNITSDAYAKVTYMRDNGLDVYETKQNAQKRYTETSEKLTEQKMTVDGVITQVSDITSKTDELTGEVKTINSEISTVKQTIEGWSSELKNTGGNNIFYYSLDFWDNSNGLEEYSDTEIMQNSISQTGYVLNNGSAKQTQSVKNGFYTCSFNYKKLLELAVCQVKINGTTYDLTETDWAEFEQAFEVKTNVIEIEFISDTDSSLYISDLMINVGKTKLSWSQNANETRTDTVTIGKGIQVNSSAKNTYHRIDADGNRTFNKATGKVVNEATDKGTETEELVVRGQAKITGLLIQKVSDQVWINSLL